MTMALVFLKMNTKMSFKPFYKLDKSRGDSRSSVGLGLSITSDIIKSHGGNIALEKSPLDGLRVKDFFTFVVLFLIYFFLIFLLFFLNFLLF